jgi:tetratricopeptide (TPR) repeat protein
MFKFPRHCLSALGLLTILFISTAVSLAQKPGESSATTAIDPFAVLPSSDALIVVDLKRFSSDLVPQLLTNDPDARALVIVSPDPKTIELLDPRAVQRVITGFRYNEKSPSDFDVVTVAQSSDAGQLQNLIRSRGSGKYREQQYGGKLLYITQVEEIDAKEKVTTVTNSEQTEWAIAALDANTLVFGSPAYVRASIDLSTGKGPAVSAELVTAVKRNSKALLSAAGLFPPALISAGQQLGNSDLNNMLSSLKRFNASVELIPAGLQFAVALNTATSEQTKSLVNVIGAFKTLLTNVAPGRTRQEKIARDLIKGVAISAEGTEVQIKGEITQASINELAKQYAARIYFSQGLAQKQKGDLDAAIVEYDKAIILDPDNANAYINRGNARTDKGAFDIAIADFDKAISLVPDSEIAYNDRCFARVKKGDFDAAIVDCDKAIALDPSEPFPYNNRGFAFASQGNFDKALSDYDKSIALDGENNFAYQNRGDARIKTGNWDGAIADYEKTISFNAKSAEAYNGLGLARYYKGELDQALTDYNKSISLNDKNDLVYSNRGYLRNRTGDRLGAMADFDKAIALNPKLAEAYNGRGLTRYFRKEFDGAIADFDKAVALNPAAPFYLNRGYARNEKSDYDGAIADYDKAISIDPKSAEAYNSRGIAHYCKDQLDNAIADYEKAIAIDPNLAEAYGNRALCLLALRRDAQAEQDLKKCFELNESLRSVFEPLAKEVKKTRPKARH